MASLSQDPTFATHTAAQVAADGVKRSLEERFAALERRVAKLEQQNGLI